MLCNSVPFGRGLPPRRACVCAPDREAGRQETLMSDRRRGEFKELQRDQPVRREVWSDIGSEMAQERTPPTYRNPNRDQSRGDWDRSRRHMDEGHSRATENEGDEGLRPPQD